MAIRDRRLGQEFPVDAVLMGSGLSTSPNKVISKGRYSSLTEVREFDKLSNIKPGMWITVFFFLLRGGFPGNMLGHNFPVGPVITSGLSTYADGTLNFAIPCIVKPSIYPKSYIEKGMWHKDRLNVGLLERISTSRKIPVLPLIAQLLLKNYLNRNMLIPHWFHEFKKIKRK